MKSLRNEKDKLEILNRLRQVSHSSQRQWGRMSPHQMICHLSDSFRMVMGERAATPTGNFLHRTVLKWIALKAPIPWPKGFKTRPEADQEIGGTKPVDFDQDMKELEKLFERFTQSSKVFEGYKHPIFGKMSEQEWLRWGYLHMDHHLRQFGV
jgi:hypothetical protein